MMGDRSTEVVRLFGTGVNTNLEAVAIIAATGLAGASWLEAGLIVGSFAVGTGLHLLCHWIVALAFGKGIDRMVLTRAGRIDYSGDTPGFAEGIVRTGAGATMNALLAMAGFAALGVFGIEHWHPTAVLALRTFAACNLILTAINFLPAIPLDGGLILRMVLERFVGRARALHIAVRVSLALMLGMLLLGLWLRQPVLVYMAVAISYDNWTKHLRVRPDRPTTEQHDGDTAAS